MIAWMSRRETGVGVGKGQGISPPLWNYKVMLNVDLALELCYKTLLGKLFGETNKRLPVPLHMSGLLNNKVHSTLSRRYRMMADQCR